MKKYTVSLQSFKIKICERKILKNLSFLMRKFILTGKKNCRRVKPLEIEVKFSQHYVCDFYYFIFCEQFFSKNLLLHIAYITLIYKRKKNG